MMSSKFKSVYQRGLSDGLYNNELYIYFDNDILQKEYIRGYKKGQKRSKKLAIVR